MENMDKYTHVTLCVLTIFDVLLPFVCTIQPWYYLHYVPSNMELEHSKLTWSITFTVSYKVQK